MGRKKMSVRPQPARARPVGRKAAAAGSATVKTVPKNKAPKKEQDPKAACSIIDSNRKTELCRNWMKGTCVYGALETARCAFAHGVDDIKHKTLRELEKEGRIPDASKHHCSLCTIWVSTGACPKGKGCVFIHDPRATGPVEATLRLPPNLEKTSSTSSKTGLSKLLCADGVDRGSPLSFPDIPRDPDSIELPADKEWYDLDLSHAPYAGGRNLSAVFKVWYSFLSTIVELNVQATAGTPIPANTTNTDADTHPTVPTSTPPRLEPPSPATTARVSYKDAATRSIAAGHSPAKTADTAAKTMRACSTTTGTTVVTSSPAASSRLKRVEGLREMTVPRPKDSVKHLPVFERLCNGKKPARLDTLRQPDTPLALGQGGARAAAASAKGDAAISPAPSSSDSGYYSPTSSPLAAAAPPSPVGGTTVAAAASAVRAEGDSYFSCPSSPARSTAAVLLKPPPGFEATHPATATGAWSSTSSTDAASWTSSGVSSNHDSDDDAAEDGIEDDGLFDFLQHFDEPLGDPWTPAAVAGESRVPATTGRLPVFAGLQSEATSTGSSRIISNGPSTGTSGDGGVFYVLLPGGGGGSRGFSDGGSYMTVVNSGGSSASKYGNRGGYVRLDDLAGTAFAPFKAACGYPVAQAGYHCQPSFVDAAMHNKCNIYATRFL